MNPNLDEIKEWFQVTEADLISAQILLDHDPPVITTACFHCQQAIEKALKAFLVWKNEPFEKTHDLTYLLELCETYGLEFDFLKSKAKTITAYAVENRYPSAGPKITIDEAREALDIANNVWRVIRGLIHI
jgi:HEPN domain-containing protein